MGVWHSPYPTDNPEGALGALWWFLPFTGAHTNVLKATAGAACSLLTALESPREKDVPLEQQTAARATWEVKSSPVPNVQGVKCLTQV